MLNIVVALKCEAKPLIEHYSLKHVPGNHAFPVYENEGIVLTVSGSGKVAAAAATAFIHTQLGQFKNTGWLNLGIAGHKDRPIGQGVLVNKITNKGSNRNWYPSIVFTLPCEKDNLITVDQIENQYHQMAVYEMEAAGFYETASRFSAAELVHCYKVISDNEFKPTSAITEDSVVQLITANIEEIDSIVREIIHLHATLQSLDKVPLHYEEIDDRWHFSAYQKGELRRLLKRWEFVVADSEKDDVPLVSLLKQCKSGKNVLSYLDKSLNARVVYKTYD